MCRDDVRVPKEAYGTPYGDNSWPINGLEIPRASLQFHTHHYFPLPEETTGSITPDRKE